jgi:predicted ArsR family transcriptional regulator
MSQKLLQAVAQNTRFRLVNLLKRSQGLSVQEIADELDMSYMGVKESCQDLEKRGLVDARREPKPEGTTGRPRMVYRLTPKAHELFPAASNPVTLELLEASKKLYGPAAAEKLLLLVWHQKTAEFVERVTGRTLRARAEALARLRDRAGHMAIIDEDSEGIRILEHHCPFLDLLREYPLIEKLEAELFQGVLKAPVKRKEISAGGLLRIEYTVGDPADLRGAKGLS